MATATRPTNNPNAQKADLIAATRKVLECEGGTMLCSGCGCELEGFASCYCKACEEEIYADC